MKPSLDLGSFGLKQKWSFVDEQNRVIQLNKDTSLVVGDINDQCLCMAIFCL